MVCNVCRVFDRNVYEKKKREGGSHLSMDFLLWSIEHDMIESILPSTLHILRIACSLWILASSDRWLHITPQASQTLSQPLESIFLSANASSFRSSGIWPAFQKAFSKKNIDSAWAKSGLLWEFMAMGPRLCP